MWLERNGRVIRDCVEGDADSILQWLTDPWVLEFYEGRDAVFTLDSIRETYLSKREGIYVCILEWNGKAIGYLQFYPVNTPSERQSYGFEGTEETVFAMDQFIGVAEEWGKGHGRQFLSMMLSYLEDTCKAQAVLLDPHTDNLRAIRCYEACGFQKVKLLEKHELHEGIDRDCWLMCRKPGK